MEHVRLGGSGLVVSQLCLGTWMLGHQRTDEEVVDRDGSLALLDAAFDRGINFFDTANVYGWTRSEQYIGEWLRTKDREDVVVASKVFFTTRGRYGRSGLSRKIISAEIDATLERLGTDYLDVYYLHGWHEGSPLRETMSVLNDLVRAGRVHYVGVSNFAAWQLVRAQWICDVEGWEPLTVIQPRYSAADHVPYTVDPAPLPLPDLFDACRALDVAACPYAPLAGGFLTGKYQRGPDGEAVIPGDSRAALHDEYGPFPDRWWRVLDAVREVAAEVDASPADVALRWCMHVPGLTSVPIVGVRSVEQLDANLGALAVTLTPDQHDRITRAGAYDYEEHPFEY